MNIESWLTNFREAWSSHNIEKVLSLFAEDVEYWETPHRRLRSFEELKSEWQGIVSQKDIHISTSLYSSDGNNHTIVWHLQYINKDRQKQVWAGTYLVSLNDEGLCTYFHNTGEKL